MCKSKNKMRDILIRTAAITTVSFVLGIAVNQIHPEGISWRLLSLTLLENGESAGWTYTSVDSAFGLFLASKAHFVDTRPSSSFTIDHIPGAMSLPFRDVFRNGGQLSGDDKTETLILYDLERNAKQVRLVARQLTREGFITVLVMRGGFVEWLDKTYPVERGTL